MDAATLCVSDCCWREDKVGKHTWYRFMGMVENSIETSSGVNPQCVSVYKALWCCGSKRDMTVNIIALISVWSFQWVSHVPVGLNLYRPTV